MSYEVEYKVELTLEEVNRAKEVFAERGFSAEGIDQQDDYYTEYKPSPVRKGNDLKRYRNESGTLIYTEKTWEMHGDQPARKEIEHEVSPDEFEKAIKAHPDAVKIKKQREWFQAQSADLPIISVTIDSVKFDHSPSMRYFIEAEVTADEIEKVSELKLSIIDFLKDVLEKNEIKEASGMLSMAVKKL